MSMLVEYDQTGRIVGFRYPPISQEMIDGLRAVRVTFLEVPDNAVINIHQTWVQDEQLVERPSFQASGPAVYADVPAGSSVFVDNTLVGVTTEDGDLELEGLDPGTFNLFIDPPFPWQSLQTEVTVQ